MTKLTLDYEINNNKRVESCSFLDELGNVSSSLESALQLTKFNLCKNNVVILTNKNRLLRIGIYELYDIESTCGCDKCLYLKILKGTLLDVAIYLVI